MTANENIRPESTTISRKAHKNARRLECVIGTRNTSLGWCYLPASKRSANKVSGLVEAAMAEYNSKAITRQEFEKRFKAARKECKRLRKVVNARKAREARKAEVNS